MTLPSAFKIELKAFYICPQVSFSSQALRKMRRQATGATHSDSDEEVLAPDDDDAVSDSEISKEHTRTGVDDRAINWTISPLILHFFIVIAVGFILRALIDGHHYNLEKRRSLSGFTALQSDMTTLISTSVALYRLCAMIWSGAVLWRCIFILLGNGGITLEKIDTLLTWQYYRPPRLLSSQVLVSIILLSAFSPHVSGPILTGSITWSSSHRLVVAPASECVTGIPGEQPQGGTIATSNSFDDTLASGFASTAWLNSPQDERTMKRVIDSVAHLPINSTLNNVTLPYFAISKLEWIRNPMTEIPKTLAALNRSVTLFQSRSTGLFELIHEDGLCVDPECSIISEKQVVVGIFSIAGLPTPRSAYSTVGPYPRRAPLAPGPCASSSLFGDLPANIGFTAADDMCLIYGHVTYVAGAAECKNCRISSRITVQNDTALAVLPSMQVRSVIDMMPVVGGTMVLQNNSLPRAYNNLDQYVTELLIRSYAASWTHFRKSTNMTSLSTEVQIAIPTSRASVLWWRVWVWLSLNLLFTLSGFFFWVVQKCSGQRYIRNPQLAAFLLDTSEVLHERDRAFCDFSSLTKDDKHLGNLHLVGHKEGHKQVSFVKK